MDTSIGVGERLIKLRISRNLSQSQVADALNIGKSTVSSYESNAISPSLEMLCSLANLYRVTTDYILGLEKYQSLRVDSLDDDELQIVTMLIDKFSRKG